MAPPKYADLGKDAKDLLNKNYHIGVVKLEGKTAAANGKTEFVVDGTHNPDSGAVGASLETKWKLPEYGLTFSEKWNTENVIFSNLTCEKIANLKFDAEATFAPVTGKKSAKCKVAHQSEYLHALGDVDLDFAGPTVNGSAVFGYNNLYAGYEASYDTANSKLVANNVALGYKGSDYTVHAAVVDASKFTGSIYHAVSSGLSAAAQVNWAAGSDATSFTLGVKKVLDNDAFVKVKVDNSLRVGLAYSQNVRAGVQVTLSGLVNGKESAGHKLGAHINLNA